MWSVTEITARIRTSATSGVRHQRDRLGVRPIGHHCDDDDKAEHQRRVGGGGQSLLPKMPCAVAGGAETLHPRTRGTHGHVRVLTVVYHGVAPQRRDEGERPDQDGQDHGADEGRASQAQSLLTVEAVAKIPDEMAQATEHVVHQDPGVGEEDQLPDDGAEEPSDPAVRSRAGGKCDEPNRYQGRFHRRERYR